MAELLKAGIGDLEGAYGGHFAASGAMIKKEDLKKFKRNLLKFLKNNPIK
jgi:single-stranded DNA-specific DHH superfamily exonuclease